MCGIIFMPIPSSHHMSMLTSPTCAETLLSPGPFPVFNTRNHRTPVLLAQALPTFSFSWPLPSHTEVKLIKKQRHYFANKGSSSQGYGFSSGHVWLWELDCEESWVPKNWCFWTVVLEKTLESPLDCKEIQLVHPKGNQLWVFIGRTDAEAETPILWPPHVKSWLIRKDPDTGRDWGQEQKGLT